MDLLTIFIIAVGLAMDCFAVSIAHGLGTTRSELKPRPTHMAVLFGLFQGGMPLIGFFAGNIFASFFNRYAPWIALALLAFIGGKMVCESLRKDEEEVACANWKFSHLLVLSVATSIDALATGVIFIPVPERLWLGVGIIALVSFLFSIAGYNIGRYVGDRFKMNVELIGGIILILIGLKIWIEGLCF